MAILLRKRVQSHCLIWSDFSSIIWCRTDEWNNSEFIVLFDVWLLSKGRFLISQVIFRDDRFPNEVDQLVNNFHGVLVESKKIFMSKLFMLNDIWNFMIFQQISHTVLEYSIVEQMVLIYRFMYPNDIKFSTRVVKNNLDSYWPYFEVRDNSRFIWSRIDQRKGVSIIFPIKIVSENLNCIHSLTLS
jgi:hypothetical protein